MHDDEMVDDLVRESARGLDGEVGEIRVAHELDVVRHLREGDDDEEEDPPL